MNKINLFLIILSLDMAAPVYAGESDRERIKMH